MQQPSKEELRRFAPSALPEYLDALQHGWNEMLNAGINTPLRLCNFLAQMSHETGGFTILRENTTWSVKRMGEIWPARFDKLKNPIGYAKCVACKGDEVKLANLAYAARADIGNQGGNDGWDYRGAFCLQDTGRFSFREAGQILGEDIEGNPDSYNVYKAMKVAIVKWQKWGMNRLADRHYIRAIGNKINRGNPYHSQDPIGHPDRLKQFSRAWAIFGDGAQPEVPDGMALGAYGATVEALQMRLRELGYPIGKIDGVFGPGVARAVAAFKLDHKRETGRELEPDEIVGYATQAALDIAGKVEVAPERAEATEKDVIAVSSTAKAGSDVQTAGTAMVLAGATGGAVQENLIDMQSFTSSVDWLPGMQSVLSPVATAATWGLKNALWVVPLVFGFWFWTRGRKVIAARLADHKFGFNLSK